MHVRFEGRLTTEDMQRHIPHIFNVHEGACRVAIAFDFEPKHPGTGPMANEISLSLFDPETSRGARHNNADQSVVLTHTSATPGYTPGAIQPGEWTVFVDTHRILPPGGIAYTLDIHVEDEAGDVAPTPRYEPASVAPRGPGWYRGDLHGHTLHSDGWWDIPDFIASARKRGLDFVTLTDHNTVSGHAQALSLAGDDLLVLGGMEMTTFYGHCLSVGLDTWREWRVRDGETMVDVARRHLDAGALFIIAHPMSRGHPYCSGCNWQYLEMMPGIAPAVEVWNGVWSPRKRNQEALHLFYSWLDQGHRLVATTGTDIHGPPPENYRPGYTHIYAEVLSRDALLDGLRRGRAFLTSGPKLGLSARDASGEAAIMGDRLTDPPFACHVRWQDCPAGSTLSLIGGRASEKGGFRTVATQPSDGEGEHSWAVTARDAVSWIIAEVRDDDGALLAVTNPLFLT